MRDLMDRHRWTIRYLMVLVTLTALLQVVELVRGGNFSCQ